MKKVILFLMMFSVIATVVLADINKIYEFPGETVFFEYSFKDGAEKVVSDFLIKPTGITLLKLEFKSKSDDHTLNVKITDSTKNEVIYNDTDNFLKPEDENKDLYPCEFTIYPNKLTKGNFYYIELSSPSVKGAEGEIAISGNVLMLTDLAKLKNLGIATEVENGPHHPLKRIEAAKIIAQTLRMEKVSVNASFTDVDNENSENGCVGVLEGMGIIKGYGNGLFMPEKEVSYYEAVKMIVCMLGYEKDAEVSGWPKGYMDTANKLGIILYPGMDDRSITLTELSEILYKALDVPLKVKTGFGNIEEYIICDGKDNPYETINTKYLNNK